jgi:Amt family ammonium transporter
MINTLVATAAAGFSWVVMEWVTRRRPSMLGFASGVVAGLVAITPAAGFAGPVGAIVLGLVVSPVCVIFCSVIKNALKYDDSLDAFGIHAVGGIIGAIGTGILVSPDLGGAGLIDWSKCALGTGGALGACDVLPYDMTGQVMSQLKGVGITIVWSTLASLVVWIIVKVLTGGRVKEEVEEEGLDINAHGEAAYHP